MPTSYTGNLRLALPTTGELSGTWGDTVNNSITSLLDDAVGGYIAVTITPTTNKQALTAVDGAADQARNAVLRLNAGTLSANFELYAPPSERTYVVYNNTGYSCTFYVATVIGGTTAAGVGVVIPNTAKMTVYLDGTNVVEQVNYMSNLALSTALPVTSGGTGVTTSTGSGNNVLSTSPTLVTPILGTPTSGVATNLTGLPLTTGVTGTLAATNGGTGQTSYAVGDVLFASTTTALSKLADVATGSAIISGGVGVAPSYGKIGLTTHVSGTLPVANGGTGLTTIAARSIPVANALDTYTTVTPAAGQSIRINAGNTAWEAYTPAAGGTGTVTSVSVVSANGLAGTVANPTTTPAITLSTSITGVLKGNGTAISAATAATDYVAPGAITTDGITMSTARMLGRTTASTGAVEEITVGSGLSLSAGTLTATGSGAALSAVTAATTSATLANGNNPIAWNWTQTTAAQTGFAIGETTASTSGAGSQYLYTVGTLAASTANPFRVQTRGVDTVNISRTGAVTITGLNGTTGSGTTGSNLSFTAGQGASTSAGGDVTIAAGSGGATSGNGGNIFLNSGANGASGVVSIGSGGSATGITGDVALSVATPTGAFRAGTLQLNGGGSSAAQSGNSGGIVLTGGPAGAVASVAGGPIAITGGAGSTTTTGGIGGAINITSGAGGLAAAGGALTLSGGGGGATGTGGATTISGGGGGSTSGNAGSVTVQGGAAIGSGSGGDATVRAGNRAGTGAGSSVSITASNGVTTGAGGAVSITAGNGVSAVGGDITLTTGTGSTQGAINFVNTNVANGAVATTVTSLGPTGSSTTIQGWLAIKVGGTARYIPFW